MPQVTQIFSLMPWIGGINTSQDPGAIQPNQLTTGDNQVIDARGSRKKREGNAYNWDGGADASLSIVGLQDYWFGTTSKAQRLLGLTSAGTAYSYNGGVRTALSVSSAYATPPSVASLLTFNNRCFIAADGVNNPVKYWNGTDATPLIDMQASYNIGTLSRSSAGTTKTIKFNTTFPGAVSSTVIVDGMGDPTYNGTYVVASVTTGSNPNDTITYVAATALTESTTTDTGGIVGQPAPQASALGSHQGRIFCNDKTNPDRLHYCQTANHTRWLGYGDSGALDVGVGDGDRDGILAIKSFRGDLFVFKRTKLYRLVGPSPELYQIIQLSDGLGAVGPNAVATVDQDDLYWASDKGIHALSSTSNYGSFEEGFSSEDIQLTWNNNIDHSRLKYVSLAYLPTINSLGVTLTETSGLNRVLTSSSVNNALYLYNIPHKSWYRWPDLPCQSLIVANDGDKKRFYFGTHTGRVVKSFTGNNYDVKSDGTKLAGAFRLVTGRLSLDGSLYTQKAIKRFILYYRPKGSHTITVTLQIDDIPVSFENTMSFSQSGSGALWGSTFVWGVSTWGYSSVLAGATRMVDGIGRGVTITIEQTGIDQDVDIQGFALEYEPAGLAP